MAKGKKGVGMGEREAMRFEELRKVGVRTVTSEPEASV